MVSRHRTPTRLPGTPSINLSARTINTGRVPRQQPTGSALHDLLHSRRAGHPGSPAPLPYPDRGPHRHRQDHRVRPVPVPAISPINAAWLEPALTGIDLLCWTQHLLRDGALAAVRIAAGWPWSDDVVTAFQRLAELPNPLPDNEPDTPATRTHGETRPPAGRHHLPGHGQHQDSRLDQQPAQAAALNERLRLGRNSTSKRRGLSDTPFGGPESVTSIPGVRGEFPGPA